MALYIIYILVLELRLMKSACVNCYYYGRYCAFGKGKISSLLFKRGDTHRFNKRKICWKDLVPDFLVTLVPLITGIVLLILDFDWLLLASVIALVVLASAGNGFVRRNLACKFCRQRKLGCPADQLFNRSKK
ncbi:TPA: hypothetical protein HA265_07745 [Candidatus Woesearchaeota archaeon]|nr:hypothetical protein [Candidatus Woesearchaeota archaeon]